MTLSSRRRFNGGIGSMFFTPTGPKENGAADRYTVNWEWIGLKLEWIGLTLLSAHVYIVIYKKTLLPQQRYHKYMHVEIYLYICTFGYMYFIFGFAFLCARHVYKHAIKGFRFLRSKAGRHRFFTVVRCDCVI